MATKPYDPFEAAMNPPEQAFEYYGEISVNAWACSLVKGFGKVPYDPNQTDEKGNALRRYTAIDLLLTPLEESKIEQPIERRMLAEFGEWKDIVLPSLRDLGVMTLQEINGKFAKVETVPTGRTYTNQNGEVKNATTLRFLAIYDTREECLAAFNGNAPATSSAPSSDNGKEKETAFKFLRFYVQNAARGETDLEKIRAKLAPMIAEQKLLAKYFTIDSPETVALITEMTAPF